MKLRTKLMMFTAAAALSANMAFAAPIDAQALADAYIADGYTYVEIKVGLTQTKLEAVKEGRKAEVIYDNETGEIIKQEFEDADADYAGRTGVEIDTVDKDFEDGDDDEDDEDDDQDDDEDDDEDDDDENDDENDDEDDDSDGESGGDDGDDDEEGNSGKG